jgi:integrase
VCHLLCYLTLARVGYSLVCLRILAASPACGSGLDPRLGVPPFRIHDLRHAYAIAEIRADRDIYDLSHHLGHSSVKVTEIYLGYRAGGRSVSRATVTQKLTHEGVLDSTETVDEMELET